MTATRVLHVTQPTEYGVGRYVAALVDAQVRAGWEVTVAAPSDGALAALVNDHGARHIDWAATREPGLTTVREVAGVSQAVRATRPHLVHLHSSKAGLVGRIAMRRSHPTIFQPHAWSFLTGQRPMRAASAHWERRAARWCDAIVCGSRAEQQRGVGAGIEARWHVVPNAIDVRRFSIVGAVERADTRRRLVSASGPLVVCVGRVCHQKGQDLLLDAWPIVGAVMPGAQLAIVGDGPMRSTLEQRAVAGVHFVGHQDDVRPWLRAADVVVQPSRYETMALSMLEAMSSARSVVATDIEGAREALCGGDLPHAGAIVAPHDAPGLARSLCERLGDPAVADAEGAAGRRRAEAHHDVAVASAHIGRVVADIVSRRCFATRPPVADTTQGA